MLPLIFLLQSSDPPVMDTRALGFNCSGGGSKEHNCTTLVKSVLCIMEFKLETTRFNSVWQPQTPSYIHIQKVSGRQQETWNKRKREICSRTWEFGLLAGVAGRSGVAAPPEFIGSDGTLPLSTLCSTNRTKRRRHTGWQRAGARVRLNWHHLGLKQRRVKGCLGMSF